MSGYTPVFSSVFDGTLHGKWPQTGVWLSLLAMADRHGHIDRSPQAIASDIGVSVETLMQCIEEFCGPDEMSRTQDHDGRRLELLEAGRPWGWRVLNHGKYREKARLESKSAREVESGRNRERMNHRRSPPETADDRRSPPLTDPSNQTKPNKKHMAGEPAEWESIRSEYPKRDGDHNWRGALEAAQARVKEGDDWTVLLAGVRRYAAWVRAKGQEGTQYVKQAKTFFGPSKAYKEPWGVVGNGTSPYRPSDI